MESVEYVGTKSASIEHEATGEERCADVRHDPVKPGLSGPAEPGESDKSEKASWYQQGCAVSRRCGVSALLLEVGLEFVHDFATDLLRYEISDCDGRVVNASRKIESMSPTVALVTLRSLLMFESAGAIMLPGM